MIHMDKNESPLQPLSRSTLHELLDQCAYHLYPDEAYEQFKKAYAQYYGDLSENQICIGNGSDDLIQKLMLTMPKGPCLTLHPDFFMYQDYARQVQRPIAYVDAREDLTFVIEDIIDRIHEVRPSFFIFSNPHNPTGHRFNEKEVAQILEAVTEYGGYLVIDEAYVEFSNPLQMKANDYLLRMRTLSKAFAIAGLRLGVLIGTPSTIEIVKQIEHPYPMSGFTLAVGRHLFAHPTETSAFIQQQRTLSEDLKSILYTYATPWMTVYPSETNFVLTRGRAALDLGNYVKARGFLPRFYNSETEQPMGDCVRYSIITEEDLTTFESLVKEWSEHYDVSN
ncbi:histidinol-phosphate aminotransferase [Staphylococcus chromogenes]|uniref:Putative pyridoxal phosphate-dependent acyltransferase n=1 Tax=Staphylococcus chromogenes TaxID=46126 RepID=A0AAE5T239_STACR|nr:histidinol-phosphate transaminase [Staphylococcus chromogenes]MBV5191627.1 histidinol-phosphate aminotransferase family protein [Staphylococcus chromogenes]MBW3132228.1 histidinol-phosphate aminotransferase family protein [Staphylococcus chromogenes]PTF38042.1 histidinol-phosphate aminotransferase [Staphylococcus chromogenes]PTF49094.1 histidinol-phosphate aminotransferase [Staphylococcus chromogenes]PTF51266.1 histidinol-phosphate aminotransferase [Staphylococcus chromogenes]